MKKFAAILMTSALILGSAVPTMAATDTSDWTSDAIENAITFYKDYTVTGGTYPAETVSFVSTPSIYNPDISETGDISEAINLTVDPVGITQATDNAVTVDIPSYSKVGVYEYTITETVGSTQGVEYNTTSAIHLVVLVTYDYDNEKLVAQYGIQNVGTDENPSKEDTITNTYDAGSLAVSKEVTGNLGDRNEDFTVTVTFKKESAKAVNSTIVYTDDGTQYSVIPQMWQGDYAYITVSLKDDETVTFTNIPAGVTYDVYELEENQNGYATSYAFSDSNKTINAGDTDTAGIKNNKDTSISTGLNLGNTLPYILVAAGAVALIVLIAVRKRRFE